MKISQRGIDFIKEAEGLVLKEYPCSVRKLTIGYGHVLRKGEKYPNGIIKVKAEKLLESDIKEAENTINRYVTVKLTQSQYDSLVSLVFNWGSGNFRKSNGLKKLNSSDYDGAIKEFSEVTNNGLLTTRRAKEAEMWKNMSDSESWITTEISKMRFNRTKQILDHQKINEDLRKTVIAENNEKALKELITKTEKLEDIRRAKMDALKEEITARTDGLLEELEKQKKQKYYRLLVISICLVVLGFIIFSYYKASAKPLDGDYSTCFTPPERCGDLIVKHIGSAKKSIYVQAYYITSKKIISALIDAKKKGIDVQLILDRTNLSEGNKTKLKMLSEAGITLYQDRVPGIAHNKVIIIDDTIVVTGSFNFTESADSRNAENIIIITNREVAKDYLDNWNNRDKVQIK